MPAAVTTKIVAFRDVTSGKLERSIYLYASLGFPCDDLVLWTDVMVHASLNLTLGRNDWPASHTENNIPGVYCPSVPSLKIIYQIIFLFSSN